MTIRNYRDLLAWQRAMDFVESVYRITREWPREESFGLTYQIRRAVVSVVSNVAEGQGRNNDKEFLRFLNIAHGSLREAETQLLIAQRLGYSAESTIMTALDQAAEVGRLMQGLMRSIQ
jgi:four helix bundle protein